MKSEDTNDPIRDRMSWLWIGVIALFTIVIGYKLLVTPLNLVEFRFNDFLALLLAIFAIALSVLFYLKANETANTFYDNTYKFTTVVSEILGRIEAGFGERLRHLDEGYSGLRERFDRIPLDTVKAEKQVSEGEKKVKQQEEQRDKLIEDLARKAKLQDEEKRELFARLRESEDALMKTRSELEIVRNELGHAARRQEELYALRERRGFTAERIERMERNVIALLGGREFVSSAPDAALQERFSHVRHTLSSSFATELQVAGIMESDFSLSSRAMERIRHVSKFHE